MLNNQVRGILAMMSVVGLGAWLSAAWPQPPEGQVDPADPLLKSIKERMGQLPRLDGQSQEDARSSGPARKTKDASGKHRAAELMLKSARLLENHGEDSQELLKIAKELRKQVVVVLQSD
jgi:hypothetical protein